MIASASNDNFTAVSPGQCFYPEMGERHDGTALFVISSCYSGYHVKWELHRHAEALAAFRAQRIRPRDMHEFVTVKGDRKWSCGVTWNAGRKLVSAKHAVIEALLD